MFTEYSIGSLWKQIFARELALNVEPLKGLSISGNSIKGLKEKIVNMLFRQMENEN